MEQTYQVLYTKSSTKKRKSYQDGQLLISSSCITLLDDQGLEVYKKKCYMPSISHGEEVVLGAYDVQIEGSATVKTDAPIIDPQNSRTAALGYVTHTSKPKIPVIANGKSTVKTTTLYAATTKPAISVGAVSKAFVSKKFAPSNPIPSSTTTDGQQVMSTTVKGMCVTSSTASTINLKSQCSSSSSSFVSSGGAAATSSEIVLDTALIRLMRPHQIQAANFLIRRLLGEASLADQEKEIGEVNEKPDSAISSSLSTSANQKKVAAAKKKLAKTQKEKEKKKKKKRKSMIVDSDEEHSDSDSDDFSLNDSDFDMDDRCFELKPPGFIHEDPSLPPAVPLSSYTGAILADEVGHIPDLYMYSI